MCLFILESVENSSHSVEEILSTDYSWGYVRFLQEWSDSSIKKAELPSIEALTVEAKLKPAASRGSRSTVRNPGRKRKAAVQPKKKAEAKMPRKDSASTSELARLLLVFQLYEDVRDSYTQTLKKPELDHGKRSKDFWEDDVAMIYNRTDFQPKMSFSAALRSVDPSKPPSQHRNGAILDSLLHSFKLIWGPIERGFRVSGQNCDFQTYLVEVKHKDVLSGIGQKLLACGEIINIGDRDHEDKNLLDILSRKSIVLNGEGGLRKDLSSCLIETPPSKKKRDSRRQSAEDHVSLASDAIVKACNALEGSLNTATPKEDTSWDHLSSEQLLESISKAAKEAKNKEHDEEIREMWKEQKIRLIEKLRKMSPSKKKPSTQS